MGHYQPMTATQWQFSDDAFADMPLLDAEFDNEIDFTDTHHASLEIVNQFTTHHNR